MEVKPMTMLCAWCEKPIDKSWINLGKGYLHEHCLDALAEAIELYIETQDVLSDLYGGKKDETENMADSPSASRLHIAVSTDK